jgi:hypothetical protein
LRLGAVSLMGRKGNESDVKRVDGNERERGGLCSNAFMHRRYWHVEVEVYNPG